MIAVVSDSNHELLAMMNIDNRHTTTCIIVHNVPEKNHPFMNHQSGKRTLESYHMPHASFVRGESFP
jgi:hypothetical protein